ncbi:lipase 3-like protein, partial [Leptotrombidium deliense]
MSKYDLPATIDYILGVTKKPKISYVGHSQGTTIALQLLASIPTYNDKIEKAILLAPIAQLCHTKSLMKTLFVPPIPQLYQTMGGAVPQDYKPVAEMMRQCQLQKTFWEPSNAVAIGPVAPVNGSRIPVILSHVGDVSMWCVTKFIQNPCKCISYFDYGPIVNLFKYKSLFPPMYDLKK